MVATLIILAIFASGAIYTMFFPILLPPTITAGITALLTPIFAFDGILPISALFLSLNWLINLLVLYLVYRIVVGLIGMINGGGGPTIE